MHRVHGTQSSPQQLPGKLEVPDVPPSKGIVGCGVRVLQGCPAGPRSTPDQAKVLKTVEHDSEPGGGCPHAHAINDRSP
eukprot:CAMPEP_0174381538 /NCGR_PEP_ID=MMETSP0811_2-20130205/124076_1 /TAXON_ID=73025 ORGANISM="Eutreptiella gymnastica-like, Strain CCMP1594" /NCGR_SAMPLE_ID=MMETSP0811_2 /ASSEMBLY_ACC=CAM_ASM_000667 /LENGTH=78 /DNA_ID=CAMNT_0015534707 /DNA_START=1706 /DNA_END=1940 /DNA_ORIENTATION=+